MPTFEWLKKEFSYGYNSGDILSDTVDNRRKKEESRIGGSYAAIAEGLLVKYIEPNAQVLELGPGKGSWSKVILDILEQDGKLSTIDFHNVSEWLNPKSYEGKLVNYQTDSNDYHFLRDNSYDVFWSFGVLCHNNIDSIYQILHNIYPKVKGGALLIHQYSDWNKLNGYGWDKGAIPSEFQDKRDDEIWWPRNNQIVMQTILEATGYEVMEIDCGLVERDSIFVARKL